MNEESKSLTNSFNYLLFFSLLIFLAEYPEKPKCIKYFCHKFPWIKWLFILGWLYGRDNYITIFITIFCVYNFLYYMDDYLYTNYENFKSFKDNQSSK